MLIGTAAVVSKLFFTLCGFGPDGPQPPARVETFKEFVSRVGGVGHNLSRSPQSPGGMQVLEGRQIAADHLLCRANDRLQSALVVGSGGSVPDGDGGGEDGLPFEVRGSCCTEDPTVLTEQSSAMIRFEGESTTVFTVFRAPSSLDGQSHTHLQTHRHKR